MLQGGFKMQVDMLMNNSDNTRMTKTLFISDLHLQQKEPAITKAFLALLANHAGVDALYILGDLFEAWIGDDDDSPFHFEIMAAMSAATSRGLKIYFIHGNRDFLLGKRFFQQTGCELLADETVINLYGTNVLMMHGDTLCTRDEAYLQSRKYMRHPIIQSIFLWLRLSLRRKIAEKMRAKSSMHMQSLSAEMMDVTQEEVENRMSQHRVQYLIHGHTHKPDMHIFNLNGLEATRIVLAAWHHHGSAFVWDDQGNKNLINIELAFEKE
jgi:UDP-2,3-diacylglucosamine hydrolase